MKVVREILETIWLFATVLSLMAEPRYDLAWWGYIVGFGLWLGNLLVAYRHFAKRGLPSWMTRFVD